MHPLKRDLSFLYSVHLQTIRQRLTKHWRNEDFCSMMLHPIRWIRCALTRIIKNNFNCTLHFFLDNVKTLDTLIDRIAKRLPTSVGGLFCILRPNSISSKWSRNGSLTRFGWNIQWTRRCRIPRTDICLPVFLSAVYGTTYLCSSHMLNMLRCSISSFLKFIWKILCRLKSETPEPTGS